MNNKYAAAASGNDGPTTSGSSSGSSGSRDTVMKWKPHATFRGVLSDLKAGDNSWGQSLGIKFTDGKLVDGVMMRRLSKSGEPEDVLKLFSWEQMPVILDENLSADDAPDVFSEEIVGKNYRYQLVGARIEADEERGVSADPEEPIPVGDFMIWEDGGKKPSASAKVFAQMLTSAGKGIMVEKHDINNWLDVGNVELREDLDGREVDVFKYIKQGDKYEFHCPNVTDVKTGKKVMVQSGGSSGSSESSSSTPAPADPEPEPSTPASDASAAAPEQLPEPVSDFVEFCRDFGLTDEGQIIDNLNEMAVDSDNSLTPEMVDTVGEANIVNEIVS